VGELRGLLRILRCHNSNMCTPFSMQSMHGGGKIGGKFIRVLGYCGARGMGEDFVRVQFELECLGMVRGVCDDGKDNVIREVDRGFGIKDDVQWDVVKSCSEIGLICAAREFSLCEGVEY